MGILPFALAAGGGQVDGREVRALVAAGVALLQRTAPLVRALQGRPSAIFLPPGAPLVVALAASDGRSAWVVDPTSAHAETTLRKVAEAAGCVFTVESLQQLVPPALPTVVLDDAPHTARWRHGPHERVITLAKHSGLSFAGEHEAEGSAEEVWRTIAGDAMSHRAVLLAARTLARDARLGARDHVLLVGDTPSTPALVYGLVAPLLAGARVTTRPAGADVSDVLQLLEEDGVSLLVATARELERLLETLAARARALDAPVLQRAIAADGASAALAERWRVATGVSLWQRRPHGAGA